MGSLPESMEALALFEYGQPAVYQKISLKTPAITQPNEVLIKVHATSINPIDVKMASGAAKRIQPAV
jgi:NADPH:quinone reductase-like Zn-dependent oxidoreductase